MKKMFSIPLMLLIVCSNLLFLPVFSENDWYGEEATSYHLTSTAQLVAFAELVNSGNTFEGKTVFLESDIFLSGTWTPIGNKEERAFAGKFDGKNFNIRGMHISSMSENYVGLFGYTRETAEICNVSVFGDIKGKYVGGIVGNHKGLLRQVVNHARVSGMVVAGGIAGTQSGTLEQVCNQGIVRSTMENTAFGGICGINDGTIEDSVNRNTVFGDMYESDMFGSYGGGIVGKNTSVIRRCYNEAEVMGNSYIGGIAADNTGSISQSKNNGSILSETTYCGGIAASNSGTINDCYNYGDVRAGASYAGGITAVNTGVLAQCTNTGAIYANNHCGGVVGDNRSAIEACVNYGAVNGTNLYIGGIAGVQVGAASFIRRSQNIGSVTGKQYVGGICGWAEGDEISDCTNEAVVFGEHGVGGIAGYIGQSAATRIVGCFNAGDIESTANYGGGIVGHLQGTAGIVSDCASVATVKGQWNYGNITGANKGTTEHCFAKGSPGRIVASSNSPINSYVWNSENKIEFENGAIVSKLNTNNDTVEDRGVWLQGGEYPVLTAKSNPADVVHTANEAEFLAAINNVAVQKIVLCSDITLSAPAEISRSLVIDGGYHSISGESLKLLANSITLKDLVLDGGAYAVYIDGAAVMLDGYVKLRNQTTAGIYLSLGSLNAQTVLLDVRSEVGDIPAIEAASSEAVVGLKFYELASQQDMHRYYDSIEEFDATTVYDIVIKAADNAGISYDVKPYYSGDSCYFMLPSNADLSAIRYCTLNQDGDVLAEITEDFSNNKMTALSIRGLHFTVKAMQSQLPTLYLDIDETNGTINAMNASPDHGVNCYGDMRLDVPQQLAAANGWETTYTSVGSDSNLKTPGTMEMRGRGNSSWSIKPIHQKPYQIKLESKMNLLGMGSAKTWNLIKCYASDFITNKISLDMGVDMGIKFSGQARFVDVYMNGNYVGMYSLTEKVQLGSTRINITDMEDAIDDLTEDQTMEDVDTTGGYLIEIDNNFDSLQFITNGNRLTIKSPENLDSDTNVGSRYQYIIDKMSELFDAVYGDGLMKNGEHFTEHIDMDSFTRYYLHQELTANEDCGLGSTFFYKDTDAIDPKIYCGPVWDSDRCFPLDFTTAWVVSEGKSRDGSYQLFFNEMMKHKEFVSYVLAYYYDNYNDNNIAATYQSYAQKAREYWTEINSAAEMTRIRWNISTLLYPNRISTFINTRSAWVDENLASLMNVAEKGEEIVLTPAEEKTILARFAYSGGVAKDDLSDELGDKVNGYKAAEGVFLCRAKLYASVNGVNTKTLEWTSDLYDNATVARMDASNTNLWGDSATNPAFYEIQLPTKGYEAICVDAKLGGTKKGPRDFKLQYSTDGITYHNVAEYSIKKNKTMEQAFENVSLPVDANDEHMVYIRFVADGEATIGGGLLSADRGGGESTINDVVIHGTKLAHGSTEEVGVVMIAIYHNRRLVQIQHISEPLPDEYDTIKVFVWDSRESMIPLKNLITYEY